MRKLRFGKAPSSSKALTLRTVNQNRHNLHNPLHITYQLYRLEQLLWLPKTTHIAHFRAASRPSEYTSNTISSIMASLTVVELGSFSISARDEDNTVLSLSTSLTLTMPPDYQGPSSVEHLCEQVASGELWIARAGSLRLGVMVECDDQLIQTSSMHVHHVGNMFIDAFEDCPVSNDSLFHIRLQF